MPKTGMRKWIGARCERTMIKGAIFELEKSTIQCLYTIEIAADYHQRSVFTPRHCQIDK